MITSASNGRIKEIVNLIQKAKARRERKVFIIEGIRLFLEVPRELFEEIYVSEAFLEKPENKALLEGLKYETVKEDVFRKISDTKTPQGILAVVKQPQYSLEQMLLRSVTGNPDENAKQPLLVVLEDIQDPGNLGTIMRTAEGAGVTGVIMTRETVDIYNPKTIRSTMGSIFRVPFLYVDDLHETLACLKANGIMLYAAHLDGKKLYDDCSYQKGTAFLIGNEGNGLKKDTADKADAYMKIPMEGKLESLNAAVATALLVYEAARQRRHVDIKS
ncbi:MAG: 23S rRNA (guanosine(2251)-2'-O)-methyltransferase RlmB [Lachnospiraceae bacterium]|nr:23S rRNA (guanosine(2251)-2'-O)-methyltransferase RlmB [Lachnospiraceae bacterium]